MSKKILIVDDDPNMLKMVGMTLRQAGFEIHVAQDAQNASLKYMELAPDLIILDIMMPGVSGLEFLQALRADPRGLQIPVILLSALSDVDDKVAGFKAGADEYITKPVDARELLARVHALLERVAVLKANQESTIANVIAVMGVKGGVGTTTVAVNLAGAVVEQDQRALVTELHSSQGTLGKALGQNRGGDLGEILVRSSERVTPKVLGSVIYQHPTKIQVLPFPAQLDTSVVVTPAFVESLIDSLGSVADHIFIDLPARLDEISIAVLKECDIVILVLEPSPVFIDAAAILVAQVQKLAQQAKKLGAIVVNRSGLASSASMDKVGELLGIPVFGGIPQAGDILASAYRRGHLLITEQPDHMAATAFRRIAAEVILAK